MTVPFLDLTGGYNELRTEIDAAVAGVLQSGRYLSGPQVEGFENEFAAFCGAEHCVTVGSGHAALELALRAMGVGPGDEVVVPSHTFIATWMAVSATGALPVPVEPDASTATMDPARIDAALTARTAAIVPVHLYGHPADLDAIDAIAQRRGVAVLEDAAQAHGARYRGRRIGSGGNAAAFSFYPGKNLGAFGDGGAVVTDDPQLARRVRLLSNYGSAVKYRHDVRGTNSRLDEVRAAVLRVKLPHLESWNARRGRIAARYLRELDGALALPAVAGWADPVWHLFVVRTQLRERLRQVLSDRGVDTQIHYPVPPHRSAAYADHPAASAHLPVADGFACEALSLPIGPHLTDDNVTVVVEAVTDAVTASCR
ncbi:DegT/DnrJ/EryC1/StrS family aminotransferase [Prauserella rugosa]|uniref:dTDP-3-amino-3,4,6-trideoxy-alpha-D-glucose transaminase n=1 Tax=Prauserella rugosa TaxID=43354 RepID=A0A660CB80_9PSEU|nr:DegT/DnrJ/EryC1/StrS family aminotransferase [Prauserella rugosa]KMS90672.1 erythromycin biosynthesis sensory transduction protein eryC1 [Streptomyces regensis]TWH20722.1 dTDP-3-amino-3,4,6-trideoxy-alpha-D-glucose transaminase [Prauserella rugosa]